MSRPFEVLMEPDPYSHPRTQGLVSIFGQKMTVNRIEFAILAACCPRLGLTTSFDLIAARILGGSASKNWQTICTQHKHKLSVRLHSMRSPLYLISVRGVGYSAKISVPTLEDLSR